MADLIIRAGFVVRNMDRDPKGAVETFQVVRRSGKTNDFRIEEPEVLGNRPRIVPLRVYADEHHLRPLLLGIHELARLTHDLQRQRTDVRAVGEAEEHQAETALENGATGDAAFRADQPQVIGQRPSLGHEQHCLGRCSAVHEPGGYTTEEQSSDGNGNPDGCGDSLHVQQLFHNHPPAGPVLMLDGARLTELKQQLAEHPDPLAWLPRVEEVLASEELFFGHGAADAADEAFWLVRHFSHRLNPFNAARLAGRLVRILEQRIRDRVPLAYLLHEAWFAGLRFYVDPRVLIPRSPLAEIIERGFTPWHPGTGRLLDLGTGSGCLALASAWHGRFDRVDAVDVSDAALAVAAINVSRLGLGDRVRVLRSDLYAQLGDARYDVIISNPPYVPQSRLRELPPEYRHEPPLALAAGEQGVDLLEPIFRGAAQRLTDRGLLIVEVGEVAGAVNRAYPQVPFLWFEFERGGEGVLALEGAQVRQYWA